MINKNCLLNILSRLNDENIKYTEKDIKTSLYDIEVVKSNGCKCLVKFKTTCGKSREWKFTSKFADRVKTEYMPGIVYVFAKTNPLEYYVVPGEEVHKYIIEDNLKWLDEKPARSKDNWVRIFRVGTTSWNKVDESQWKDRWDLLK